MRALGLTTAEGWTFAGEVAVDILFGARCVAVGHDAHDFSISCELSFNFCFATHTLHSRADAHRSYFENQGVSGNDRTAKARFFDPGKQHEFVVTILDLAEREDGTHLRQGFDYQNSGHYGRAGKVALEERLVNADLLDSHNSFPRHQLNDPVDK